MNLLIKQFKFKEKNKRKKLFKKSFNIKKVLIWFNIYNNRFKKKY